MAYQQLQDLARSYPSQDESVLPQLAGEYRIRHEREVLELAALAADVGMADIKSLGLEPEPDPQLLEAFQRAYPSRSVDDLRQASEEQLQGWANGIKGTLFEVWARDMLNAGGSVGDIKLPPGAAAVLADPPVQPGWDLAIVDEAGETLERLQLKATSSLGYVKGALEKYPDFSVIVPQELDGAAALDDRLEAVDVTNEHFNEVVDEQLGELSESAVTDLLHQSAEFAFDALPAASAVVIGVLEGRQVLMGRSTVEQSLRRGAARLGGSVVYSVLGAGLTAAGAGVVAIPTVTALRLAEGRVRHWMAMEQRLEEQTDEIVRWTQARAGI